MLEGRKALPKAIQPLVSRRMENFLGDRSHRHVIEAIRSGNNDEFFEAMEGGVVCQCVTNECCQCVYSQGLTSTLWMMLVKHCWTGLLLLVHMKWLVSWWWCYINGLTISYHVQVDYLLEHSADVNRGLKSSSLHYAACFGRPNIVKVGEHTHTLSEVTLTPHFVCSAVTAVWSRSWAERWRWPYPTGQGTGAWGWVAQAMHRDTREPRYWTDSMHQ